MAYCMATTCHSLLVHHVHSSVWIQGSRAVWQWNIYYFFIQTCIHICVYVHIYTYYIYVYIKICVYIFSMFLYSSIRLEWGRLEAMTSVKSILKLNPHENPWIKTHFYSCSTNPLELVSGINMIENMLVFNGSPYVLLIMCWNAPLVSVPLTSHILWQIKGWECLSDRCLSDVLRCFFQIHYALFMLRAAEVGFPS